MSQSEVTILTEKQAKRLLAICEGIVMPLTLEELCCYNAYVMRVQGYAMDHCLDEMDPPVMKMDVHQLRHFLVGVAFAENDIIRFGEETDIDDDNNKTKH